MKYPITVFTMKIVKKLIRHFKGIGFCTDCGKEDQLVILSHYFSALHDLFVTKKPPVCKFIGSHDKKICNACMDYFMNEWNMYEFNRYVIRK